MNRETDLWETRESAVYVVYNKLMSMNNKYRTTDAQRLEGRSRSKKVGLSEEKTMVEGKDWYEFCLPCELHMLYNNVSGEIWFNESEYAKLTLPQVLIRFIPSLWSNIVLSSPASDLRQPTFYVMGNWSTRPTLPTTY